MTLKNTEILLFEHSVWITRVFEMYSPFEDVDAVACLENYERRLVLSLISR